LISTILFITVECCSWAGANRRSHKTGQGRGRDGSTGGRSHGCEATLEDGRHPHHGRPERRL